MLALSHASALPFSLLGGGLAGSHVVLLSDIAETLHDARVHGNWAPGADVAVAPRSGLAARRG